MDRQRLILRRIDLRVVLIILALMFISTILFPNYNFGYNVFTKTSENICQIENLQIF